MYLCYCDLRIVLIFNNRKNKYEKNITKIFIVLNVILRIHTHKLQIFSISFKIIHFHYVIIEQ